MSILTFLYFTIKEMVPPTLPLLFAFDYSFLFIDWDNLPNGTIKSSI